MGTLTRKIPRQLQLVVITPPSTGPSAAATPVIAPQTPNATPRSRPRKLCAEQRQRGGEHDRPADALAAARQDQHQRRLRQPAQQRAER